MSDLEINMEDYEDLSDVGVDPAPQQTKPEDEFFHSVYIGGKSRTNETGQEEKIGKLHIRGVEINLDEVNMIITHIKRVLVKKDKSPRGYDVITCFSYKEGEYPWSSTSGHKCGSNSAERSADEFCKPCREQLIVSGIYCNSNGNPVLTEEKKPTFVFLRGKGIKYSNIADYISKVTNEDLPPIIQPVTDKSKLFEKQNLNHKRWLTKVTVGTTETRYGINNVFELEAASQIPDKQAVQVLNIAKSTVEEFNKKFKWQPRSNQTQMTPGTTQDHQIPDGGGEQTSSGDTGFDFNDVQF